MSKVETVKIKADHTESGFMVINKSDYDKSKHQLFGEKSSAKQEESEPKAKKAKGKAK